MVFDLNRAAMAKYGFNPGQETLVRDTRADGLGDDETAAGAVS